MCHTGQPDNTFTTREEAHVGLIIDPSAPDSTGNIAACVGCHEDEVNATANSLHTNLWGEIAAIELRGGAGCTVMGSDLEAKFTAKCASCHTTCGQCHISRPNSVGGGFPVIASQYRSHRFRSPDMSEQCTACHGSRIGTDFKGELDGNIADVHYTSGIYCIGCHTKEEIHGDGLHDGDHYNHRYEVKTMPRCEDCHGVDKPMGWVDNSFHSVHVNQNEAEDDPNLQCQVCHSQPYKNCTNCHALDPDPEKYEINDSRIQFKIARNPGPERPRSDIAAYDNVVVRHVPIDPNTYADWDDLTLPDYLVSPTWKYASPHNVIKSTPQTEIPEGGNCRTSCHETPDSPEGFFLRLSDLFEEGGVIELPDHGANTEIVIPADFPNKK